MKQASFQTRKRLPMYLGYLRTLSQTQDETAHVSATSIAAALGLNDVLVRKDLASVSEGGKPKTGYGARSLAQDIEKCLGGQELLGAVLVGAGGFGRAVLGFEDFARYGLDVAMVFDADVRLAGTRAGGRCVLPLERLEDLCLKLRPRAGIIAVTDTQAQAVCDRLLCCGIRAVWNLSPAALKVPDGVLVIDEDIGASLRALARRAAQPD